MNYEKIIPILDWLPNYKGRIFKLGYLVNAASIFQANGIKNFTDVWG